MVKTHSISEAKKEKKLTKARLSMGQKKVEKRNYGCLDNRSARDLCFLCAHRTNNRIDLSILKSTDNDDEYGDDD